MQEGSCLPSSFHFCSHHSPPHTSLLPIGAGGGGGRCDEKRREGRNLDTVSSSLSSLHSDFILPTTERLVGPHQSRFYGKQRKLGSEGLHKVTQVFCGTHPSLQPGSVLFQCLSVYSPGAELLLSEIMAEP